MKSAEFDAFQRNVHPERQAEASSARFAVPCSTALDGGLAEFHDATVEGHNPEDPGIGLLADALREAAPEEVLLVHCGDLPGIAPGARRLVLDIRETSDSVHHCIPALADPSAHILPGVRHAAIWPRAHLGKDFSQLCLALGAWVLMPGGNLWCAVRKRKGADGLASTMDQLLGGHEVVDRARGYRLLRGRRGPAFDADHAASLMGRRYRFGDPLLGEVELETIPGVFSRRGLDAGSRALIEVVRSLDLPPPRWIVDLGTGVGPLLTWGLARWNDARGLAVDSNYLAAAMTQHNMVRLGWASRVCVFCHDGLPAPQAAAGPCLAGGVDLALVNPPTHATPTALRSFFGSLTPWMAPGGRGYAVVNRPGRARQSLEQAGATIEFEAREGGYWILGARWPKESEAALS